MSFQYFFIVFLAVEGLMFIVNNLLAYHREKLAHARWVLRDTRVIQATDAHTKTLVATEEHLQRVYLRLNALEKLSKEQEEGGR